MPKQLVLVLALFTGHNRVICAAGWAAGHPAACRPDVVKHCKPLLDSSAPSAFSMLAGRSRTDIKGLPNGAQKPPPNDDLTPLMIWRAPPSDRSADSN
jgi:hypothetical protein